MAEPEDRKKVGRRAGDADVLALAEGLAASLGPNRQPTDLATLRDVVESYPDVGNDGAGLVATSLAGLLSDFLGSGGYDRGAIRVHIRAWRFMVSRKPDPRERAAILQGLNQVRSLFRVADAA